MWHFVGEGVTFCTIVCNSRRLSYFTSSTFCNDSRPSVNKRSTNWKQKYQLWFIFTLIYFYVMSYITYKNIRNFLKQDYYTLLTLIDIFFCLYILYTCISCDNYTAIWSLHYLNIFKPLGDFGFENVCLLYIHWYWINITTMT